MQTQKTLKTNQKPHAQSLNNTEHWRASLYRCIIDMWSLCVSVRRDEDNRWGEFVVSRQRIRQTVVWSIAAKELELRHPPFGRQVHYTLNRLNIKQQAHYWLSTPRFNEIIRAPLNSIQTRKEHCQPQHCHTEQRLIDVGFLKWNAEARTGD